MNFMPSSVVSWPGSAYGSAVARQWRQARRQALVVSQNARIGAESRSMGYSSLNELDPTSFAAASAGVFAGVFGRNADPDSALATAPPVRNSIAHEEESRDRPRLELRVAFARVDERPGLDA